MAQKRLTRSVTDRKIAGVCGGLAEFFDMDSSLVRFIFILLIILPPAALLPYVILWIVMPEEEPGGRPSGAVQVAEERYARGEITAEELERIRNDLRS